MVRIDDRVAVNESGAQMRRRRVPPGHGMPQTLPPQLVELWRPVVEPLTERLTVLIQDRILDFGGTQRDASRATIERTVRAGITSFIDKLAGDPTSEDVDEMFQQVGREEAYNGRGLENLRATVLVATHSAWRTIHRRCREYQVPEGILGRLGDAMFAHIDHLEKQMTLGHLAARMEMQQELAEWRGAMAAELLSPRSSEDLDRIAARHRWPLPSEVEVVAIATPRGRPFPDLSMLPDAILVHRAHPVSAIIGAPDQIARVRPRLPAYVGRDTPVASSWPVSPYDAPSALRWATKALEMRSLALLPGTGPIDCADHVGLLWVHAEPLIRDRIVERELTPLMAEPERNRLALAETLLLQLETHGSAPALAEKLGVHPQTVRYRVRRLREIFGDRPATGEGLPLLLALRAVLPLWRAEQESRSRPAP